LQISYDSTALTLKTGLLRQVAELLIPDVSSESSVFISQSRGFLEVLGHLDNWIWRRNVSPKRH